jgi:hypothetical protein
MTTKVSRTSYKDQPAVTIETGQVSAQFLPGVGAKLASLVYKPHDFELLVQRPDPIYRMQSFDGDYVAGECSGLDDMFPTIDTCFYDRYPWDGVKMADHGEVWSLAWDHAIHDDRVHFGTYGVRFPYQLDKWVSFTAENILRLDYRLTNRSAFDFDFLWAAHMMINLEEGVELVLPSGVKTIAHTFSMNAPFGQYGTEYDWPVARLADGSPYDLRWMRPKTARQAYKYYLKGRLLEGWCGLRYPRSNFSLALSFPVSQVPYLGVLPNEGGWQDLYNIFLEPCTATFDRPDVARYREENSTIQAHSVLEWHLNISLAEGCHFTRVRENGEVEAA